MFCAVRELKMTFCFLDLINVSKVLLAYEKAADFICKIFEESNFGQSEKHSPSSIPQESWDR